MTALANYELQRVTTSKESALGVACERALVVIEACANAAEKGKVLEDLRALKAVAQAYKVSADTQRKLAETSLLCLRSFGESLLKNFPKLSNTQRERETGIAAAICCHAVTLASFPMEELLEVFAILKKNGKDAGVHRVTALLKDRDPETQRKKEERWQRIEAENARREADPEWQTLRRVWEKVGSNWLDASREILRLAREVAALKAGRAAA